MNRQAYPLAWPVERPRTPASKRRRATFGKTVSDGSPWVRKAQLTVSQALSRLATELTRLGRVSSVVISTNVKVRRDGLPYSGLGEPSDPGVAVYFDLDGKPHCFPCDAWDRLADNVAAIAAHIGALRSIERWGVGSVEQAFTGYRALPAAGETTRRPWREVLGVPSDESGKMVVKTAIKSARFKAHPDRHNGDRTLWDEVEEAARAATAAMGLDS